MRISDWSSDVCSSDLCGTRPKTGSTRKNPSCCGLWENWGERDRLSGRPLCAERRGSLHPLFDTGPQRAGTDRAAGAGARRHFVEPQLPAAADRPSCGGADAHRASRIDPEGSRRAAHASGARPEEHTSELKSLMRIPYAVFCLKKKKTITH